MKPLLFSMNPDRGYSHDETEVWIKGAWFHRSSVIVDERQATVTEVKENLLTVIFPKRLDTTSSLTVKVKVRSVVVSN